MRIICPNCEAQYEVPEDAIPAEGRDVQCSNCGMTWMQAPTAESGVNQAQNEPEEFIAETQASQPQDAPGPFEEFHETEPQAAPLAAPARKEIDPEVAEILRKEAEREQSARQQERESLESQPDLGLHDMGGADEVQSARARMTQLRSEDYDTEDEALDTRSPAPAPAPAPAPPPPQPPIQNIQAPEPAPVAQAQNEPVAGNVGEAAAAAAAVGSRRELLPDIEEINSSLRSTEDRDLAGDDLSQDAPIRKRKKRGFRRGFWFAVLIILIAALIYVFAPQIAQALPQIEPVLGTFVGWVDSLRAMLDTQVQSLLKWLDATAAATTSNG